MVLQVWLRVTFEVMEIFPHSFNSIVLRSSMAGQKMELDPPLRSSLVMLPLDDFAVGESPCSYLTRDG